MRETITVRCASATAFRVFTAEIGRWWPLADFSLGTATDCHFEPYVDGRLYQVHIEVSFRPVDGGTQLVHASWDKLKTGGAERRESYDGGWGRCVRAAFQRLC